MSAPDNGGPAFPVLPPCDMEGASASGYPFSDAGMTLRDYFAAKAMQGMLAGHFACYGHDNYWKRDSIAEEAYEIAEAMLKARAP